MRFLIKKGDFAVIIAVFFLAVLTTFIFLSNSPKKVCIISQNNVIMEEVKLSSSTKKIITVEGKFQTLVEIDGDQVRISSSTCPSQLCVHSGWIKLTGQALVCLPNQVVVTLSRQGSQEVDVVAN